MLKGIQNRNLYNKSDCSSSHSPFDRRIFVYFCYVVLVQGHIIFFKENYGLVRRNKNKQIFVCQKERSMKIIYKKLNSNIL